MPVCLLTPTPPPPPLPLLQPPLLYFFPSLPEGLLAAFQRCTLHHLDTGGSAPRAILKLSSFFFWKHSSSPVCCVLTHPHPTPRFRFMRPSGDAAQARVVCSLMKPGKTNKLITFFKKEKEKKTVFTSTAQRRLTFQRPVLGCQSDYPNFGKIARCHG